MKENTTNKTTTEVKDTFITRMMLQDTINRYNAVLDDMIDNNVDNTRDFCELHSLKCNLQHELETLVFDDISEKIEKELSNACNKILTDIQHELDITSGDFTPTQEMILDETMATLKNTLIDIIKYEISLKEGA